MRHTLNREEYKRACKRATEDLTVAYDSLMSAVEFVASANLHNATKDLSAAAVVVAEWIDTLK